MPEDEAISTLQTKANYPQRDWRRGREARSVPRLDFDLTRDLAVSEVEDDVLDVVASVRQGHEESEGDPLLAEHLV